MRRILVGISMMALLLMAAPALAWDRGHPHRHRSAPEFGAAAVGTVVALLAGGGVLLARRRRR